MSALRRFRGSRSFRWLAAIPMLLAVGNAPVFACSVCYGAAKDSMIDGGQNAILFMLLLTYLLLGGGAFLMITMRRRIGQSTRGN